MKTSTSLIAVLIVQALIAQTRTAPSRVILPTGQFLTPTAAPGSTIQQLATGLRSDGNADASQAVKTALSPDGKTLLILTSGWNNNNKHEDGGVITYPLLDPLTGTPAGGRTNKAEWVFVYAMNPDGTVTKQQQINIPSSYGGLVWEPSGMRFYVSGGANDRVLIYRQRNKEYVPDAPFILLGHNSDQTAPLTKPDGSLLKGTPASKDPLARTLVPPAIVAGMDISADGKTLVAANFENDSVSICDTATRKVIREVRFAIPGGTVAKGEFPYDVAIRGDASGKAVTAYVTSQRDDMVMVVNIANGTFSSIPVGVQPNRLILDPKQATLYVVNGNSDSISVIDTASNKVRQTISLSRPFDKYKGANPNSIAFSPDGAMLYVTLGFENAVATVDLRSGHLTGRIPTGWYPTSVSVDAAGDRLYVCTFKSVSGPNPGNGRPNPTNRAQRSYPLEKAQLHIIPVPEETTLAQLTQKVDLNNGLNNRADDPKMAFLRNKINHVIYVIKENKTYDQVLGDLSKGNGDPSLNQFPQAVTPNHHQLALTFGVLDNFCATGEVSGVGWSWSTWGNSTDYNEKTIAVNYGNGGPTYDAEGQSRNIAVGLPQNERITAVLDPTGASNILPGTRNVDAPKGAGDLSPDAVGGFLWDSALRAGKSVRNWGFFVSQDNYETTSDPSKPDPASRLYLPISATPFASKMPQAVPMDQNLIDKTDIYFRGFDMNAPDQWRVDEWIRDVTANGLPQLSLVRLPHNHFGNARTALAGVRTPTEQMADNDLGIGRVVDWVSHSQYWNDTVIFMLEDDAQSGADHVDSHRSPVYVASPYNKRGAVIPTNYNTINVVRTIADLLGIDHLGLADANATPMSDVFITTADLTPYTAIVPGVLCAPPVDPDFVPACKDPKAVKTAAVRELHDASWWAKKMKNLDFSDADENDDDDFNHILWSGLIGRRPYPTGRSGEDLTENRDELLKKWRAKQTRRPRFRMNRQSLLVN